ncbi:MAG: radical SAM protein [Tannerella sp.]|jgi:wyosine [tRNA(Phe)-imidazoG37] synthetase (radical SAM superfamily)|nr:radical SAM protein [Tannerella sp.]
MSTILFDKIVYGPVHSRRLGVSLGINLSPTDGKRCTFDCIYCECGLNAEHHAHTPAPFREDVKKALTEKLAQMKTEEMYPDVITFSGNGEPTVHPDFAGIIDDTLEIRNKFCPEAKVAVLSNSTMLHKEDVVQALCNVDENLMKLDAARDELIGQIDQPVIHDFTAAKLIEQLGRFNGKLVIQTIFLQGEHNGVRIDNTRDEEVDRWIDALKKIRPEKVMIYTISRETPVKTLQKVPMETLEKIADKVRIAGFPVSVSG